jgi:hypothetical protein
MDGGSIGARLERVEEWGRGRSRLVIRSLLIASVAFGAALGAGFHPASSLVRSESQLSVTAQNARSQPTAWHTVEQVLKLPTVRAQVAQLGGVEASALRIGTSGDPQSSLISVYADASTARQAELLANSAASVAVNFLHQTIEAAVVTRSTFENSSESWDLGAGMFVLPPRRISPTHAVAHTGVGSLEADCVTVVAGGCGPYLRLERAFRVGRAYSAAAWVKASGGIKIRMVLGRSSQDVGVGAVASGGPGWKRLSVTWIPNRDGNLAVAVLQVMSLGASHFNVDDVEAGPRAAIQHGETAAVPVTGYKTVVPATTSSSLGSGHTPEWAAGGAAAGLLVGAAAAGAAVAASRRRGRARGRGQETLF